MFNLVFCFFPGELGKLSFLELVLEYTCLLDSISVDLVFDYLLLQHLVTEFELVDTVNEVLLADEQTLP